MAGTDASFEVYGLKEQLEQLDSLLMSNSDMSERVRDIIRTTLKEARDALSSNAQSGLQMMSDPRQASKAIRFSVYRQILGGNVNILNKRKAGAGRETLPNSPNAGRGGNRRKRSGKTIRSQSYFGTDRGFVLRFLNQGTDDRRIAFTPNPKRGNTKWTSNPNTGNRGRISDRPWFGSASQRELENATKTLERLFEGLIAERTK